MRAPIQSIKKYIQVSLATVLAGARLNTLLVNAVDVVGTTNSDVITGSIVKAVFVEMWVRAGDTAPGSTLVTLMKVPGDGTLPSFTDVTNLTDYSNKKNVLYHTQGLTNDQDADAIPFVRQWFKIPKGKQRFGLGDRLVLVVAAQALDNIVCGFATYKSYT